MENKNASFCISDEYKEGLVSFKRETRYSYNVETDDVLVTVCCNICGVELEKDERGCIIHEDHCAWNNPLIERSVN